MNANQQEAAIIGADVRAFGAVGDGVAKDTAAIQRAIDHCEKGGGGRVLLPAGQYLSGTIYLKSNVELHLTQGATLLGSPDRADYNADNDPPESVPSVNEKRSGAHLLIAYRQTNVAVTGQGAIDGQALHFFHPLDEPPGQTYACRTVFREVDRWRPNQMLWFCRCQRVLVTGVKLVDPPAWTLMLHGCRDVQIRGITCVNSPLSRNGDGIDIDCCQNVTVSDCIVRTGDDCLTVRANAQPLGDDPRVCENVVVSNCVFSSPTCAIRVGVGTGVIRNCSFTNIVVTDARTGICVQSCYSNGSVHIEQVHFSDFVMDCILPVNLNIGPNAQPGEDAVIQDVSLSRFRVTAFAGSQIVGRPGLPVRRVRLSNFEWCVRGGTENCELRDRKPDVFPVDGFKAFAGHPGLPAALYGVHLEDCLFEDIRLRWDAPSAVWRDGFYFEDCRGLEFQNLALRRPHREQGVALHLCAVEDVWGRDCRNAKESGFLRLEDCSQPETIRFA